METAKITITPQHNDKIELEVTNGYEIKVENGKCYVVKNKPQYPKTYEECCEVLGIEEDLRFVYEDIDGNHINPACISNYRIRRLNLYHNFEKLSICRDAYWKIAGKEMGLDKPWEPDWDNLSTNNEFIKIGKGCFFYSSRVLVFPTKKMRDAFFDNFKDLIVQCKELL